MQFLKNTFYLFLLFVEYSNRFLKTKMILNHILFKLHAVGFFLKNINNDLENVYSPESQSFTLIYNCPFDYFLSLSIS